MDATRPAPTDNLVRIAAPQTVELRSTGGGDGNTMVGHFAVFNEWTEINSAFEGNFLERIAPGAFKDTFATRSDKVRVLYDHGMDPSVGNKPLGTPTVMKEDRTGAYYEVDLFDTSYVNDLKPAIRAGQLGASFRFRVTAESWEDPTEVRSHNPQMVAERTITGAELYEFGPVTFPAYADATAGLRSGTDTFIEKFLTDTGFLKRFTERAGPAVVEKIRAALPPTAEVAPDEEPTVPEPDPVPVPTELEEDSTTRSTTADGSETGDPNPSERAVDPYSAVERRRRFNERVRHLA